MVAVEGEKRKTALRIGGHLAERLQSSLLVLPVEKSMAKAVELTNAAERYLAAFDMPSVETLARENSPESEKDILSAAERTGADVVVVGRQPRKLLQNLLDETRTENAAFRTKAPLIIAR